jgi:hypothetical protein
LSWRLARSLIALKAQIDAMAPNRSRASDGTIGDAAHSARKSDHNPNPAGVVCALDITHDPAGGMDCHKLAEAMQAARDKRIGYIIWNGQIMSGSHSERAWVTRPYTGTNPHRKHLHVSVVQDAALYDDNRPWTISKPKPSGGRLTVEGKVLPMVRMADGTAYAPVRALCEALGATVEFDELTGAVEVKK